MLLLPPEDTNDLLAAINTLEDTATWGVRQIDSSLFVMDIATFVENVLPRALAAMGAIMDLTPVEKLPGAISVLGAGLDPNAKIAVRRLRLLSGLA